MKMCLESRNPIVEPPEVRKMPGGSKVNRRREAEEVKKDEKLSKFGITMTSSICRGANHNKRSCPKNLMPKTTLRPTTKCVSVLQQSSMVVVNIKEEVPVVLVEVEVKEQVQKVVKRGQGL